MPTRRADVRSRLGAQLRALRARSGFTQEEVGEAAGYTAKYISEIERGLRDPPLSTVDRILEHGLGAAPLNAEDSGAAPTALLVREPQLPPVIRHLAEEIAAIDDEDLRRRVVAMTRALVAFATEASRKSKRRRR